MEVCKLRDLSNLELKPIRDGFGEGLLEIGGSNSAVVALSADLTESVRMDKFAEHFPERFFQTGVSEQNMAVVSAGLALEGKIPFMGSFANFSPGRNYDQIRTSIAMMNANVKIISSHAGFSHGSDGISVQMLEDIAIMRSLPNMRVIIPADANQAKWAVEKIAQIDGPVYLRLGRAETPLLFDDMAECNLNKQQLLREGSDLSIVACGYLVFRALLAAENLHKNGIEAQVINLHTIKPINETTLLEYLSKTKAVVTAEEAQMFGGMGSAIAEILAKKLPIPQEFVAVNDTFGESGSSIELHKSRGLMEDDIIEASLRVLKRKEIQKL